VRQKLTSFSGDTIGSILLTEASANSRCFVVVVVDVVATSAVGPNEVSISVIVMLCAIHPSTTAVEYLCVFCQSFTMSYRLWTDES
jgi:hypothetical protein